MAANQDLGPVSLPFFHRNSNSMEILFHSHLDFNTVIATKFCTCHDSCCRGMCKYLLRSDGQRRSYGKANFPSNFNCEQKTVSETGPRTSTHYTVRRRTKKSGEISKPWEKCYSCSIALKFDRPLGVWRRWVCGVGVDGGDVTWVRYLSKHMMCDILNSFYLLFLCHEKSLRRILGSLPPK